MQRQISFQVQTYKSSMLMLMHQEGGTTVMFYKDQVCSWTGTILIQEDENDLSQALYS